MFFFIFSPSWKNTVQINFRSISSRVIFLSTSLRCRRLRNIAIGIRHFQSRLQTKHVARIGRKTGNHLFISGGVPTKQTSSICAERTVPPPPPPFNYHLIVTQICNIVSKHSAAFYQLNLFL